MAQGEIGSWQARKHLFMHCLLYKAIGSPMS